jgi:hypothetical protein
MGQLHMDMEQRRNWSIWAPRVAALLFTAFMALFAMDAWEGVEGIWQRTIGLLMHLAPAGLCLLVLLLAWRREWIGSSAFALLALLYAVNAWERPDWVLTVGGPLVLLAVLYALAWRDRRRGA